MVRLMSVICLIAVLALGASLRSFGTRAADATPEWFYRGTFVGNPDRAAPNGGQTFALVDFTSGRYLVMDPLDPAKFARFEVSEAIIIAPPVSSSISGFALASDAFGPRLIVPPVIRSAMTPAQDPVPDVVATMFEMDVAMPETVAAGRQIWQISNAGALYHELAVLPVPAGATKEQVGTVFDAMFQGQPLPADFFPTWITWQPDLVNGAGVMSPRAAIWAQVDLEPGTYAAVCFAPTANVPHLMMGMIKLFTVSDTGVATPAP